MMLNRTKFHRSKSEPNRRSDMAGKKSVWLFAHPSMEEVILHCGLLCFLFFRVTLKSCRCGRRRRSSCCRHKTALHPCITQLIVLITWLLNSFLVNTLKLMSLHTCLLWVSGCSCCGKQMPTGPRVNRGHWRGTFCKVLLCQNVRDFRLSNSSLVTALPLNDWSWFLFSVV